jgi:flagellar hook-associated protein 1 FlgK
MSEFMTTIADARVDSDREAVARSAELTTLKELEFAGGVDTDAELETLLRIEQSYAASAQVISTVDELLQQLLAI